MISNPKGEQSPPPKVKLEDRLVTLQDAEACDKLAKELHKKFTNENDDADLEGAITCARKTIELCSSEDPRLHRYCFRVANYLNSRHRRSNQPFDEDLDEALEYLEIATTSTGIASEPVREKANRLGVAFNCHVRLYLGGRDNAYSDALIAFNAVFEARLEFGDWDKTATVLHDMWAVQLAKFDDDPEKDLELLDLPIDYADKALEAAGRTGINWTQILSTKLKFLEHRARNNSAKKEEDYREAVATCRILMDEGVDLEDDDQDKAAYNQWRLGRMCFLLSGVTGSADDYHEATYNLQRASEATPRDHPKWKARYDLFQAALEQFGTMLGRPPGLNRIIFSQERIVTDILASEKAEDQGEPQAEALYQLAQLLQLRYVERNTIEDLISVTENLERAATKTSAVDPEKLTARLGLAAECYEILYHEEDDPKYLEHGIQAAQKAVNAAMNTENLADRKRAALYSALGRCMAALSEEDDDKELMEGAVEAGEAAIAIVGTEDASDDDENYKQERQRYIYALEDWKESLG
ncbi:hypothetical protein BJX63DRAFT_107244 [Aspergillus granulosus]|uniref:KIF-binding protein n=1 Tax=Aspergillus granulosus TaxID=176169 RepID=A0ABR4GTX7_9EURO